MKRIAEHEQRHVDIELEFARCSELRMALDAASTTIRAEPGGRTVARRRAGLVTADRRSTAKRATPRRARSNSRRNLEKYKLTW
jgi:hypothetical protein